MKTGRDYDRTPEMPDNAEASIKCGQCGNVFEMSEGIKGQMVTCPMCGTTVELKNAKEIDASNEGY